MNNLDYFKTVLSINTLYGQEFFVQFGLFFISSFVISKWHLSTNNKYLNGYTERWCTKYKLLLTSSDISA